MDYIKYTVDGKDTYLENVDGKWVEILNAPKIKGNYAFNLELNKDGRVTYINSDDPRIDLSLSVMDNISNDINLLKYLPEFMQEILELKEIMSAENIVFNIFSSELEYFLDQMFLDSASPDTVLRLENFLGIKGEGTLSQRKSYILALIKKGDKLSEKSIKTIVNTITGSKAIVTFYTINDVNSPKLGHAVLLVQVLSPDNNKDYKYEDIQRALQPLVPAHIELIVMRYFATWGNVKDNYSDWSAVARAHNWKEINDYIPPL